MRLCILGGMEWHEYVRQVVGTDRQVVVAQKTGIDQTTISRWLRPSGDAGRISSQNVAKFARGYSIPVLQAFVVAGFLTAEEAGIEGKPFDLGDVATDQLMTELRRRLPS